MPSTDIITFKANEHEFSRAMDTVRRMQGALDEKKVRRIHARHLRPVAQAMKQAHKSSRVADMIGVTTAKRKSPPYGARVGVVRNDKRKFPKFSSYSTARLIEYGSDGERFRNMRTVGVITGRQSTGVMPAQPALRPVWDSMRNTYIKNTETDLVKEVEKEANK